MARLAQLRAQVADLGIVPRRTNPDGTTSEGLPTEVYYLKVKELAELVADPSLAEGYIEMAKIRSRKRRRKKYLKEKTIDKQFQPGGHTNRLREVLDSQSVKCLGGFESDERFISETGFARAKRGYIYQVGGRRIALTVSEANRAWIEFNIPVKNLPYREPDLTSILSISEDRIYKGMME